MRSFFKIFFASLLAVTVFSIIVFFFLLSFVGRLASKNELKVEAQSVLVLDLNQHYAEQLRDVLSLYLVGRIRMYRDFMMWCGSCKEQRLIRIFPGYISRQTITQTVLPPVKK